MDEDELFMPEKVLTPKLLSYLPEESQLQLKQWEKKLCDEYFRQRAASACIQQYDERQTEMQSQIADLEIKLEKSVENVNELRSQLDSVTVERNNLLETITKYDRELGTLRSERNIISEERDTLMRKVERQKLEVERMQVELGSTEQQLKNCISGKCEAIARLGDIESKEASLRMKEQRIEQERELLNNQIQTLSDDLNRTINELQNARTHNRLEMMQIETQLKSKIEELRIMERQCNQLQEENAQLKEELQREGDESRDKLEECQKFIDRLRNELNAKTKLAELYKGEAMDQEKKSIEIISVINDHKRMLKEAEHLHGEMETKLKAINLKHDQEIEEKDKEIEGLKNELESSKELIKAAHGNSIDNAISQVSQSAAIASRLMRADLSMTELYSMFVKATEELEIQKRENGRLTLQIKTILNELQEKAPEIQKTRFEYEKIIEANNILAHQRDELLAKQNDLEEKLSNAIEKLNHNERTIKREKQLHDDQSRQICRLLMEIRRLRFGDINDHNDGGGMETSTVSLNTDPSDIIGEHLVTFRNLTEMQMQNRKLLTCVRDLSMKCEEATKRESQEKYYKEKLEISLKKFEEMQETLNKQNSSVTTLLTKCERYKKLYFEVQRKINKHSTRLDDNIESEEDSANDDDDDDEMNGGGDAKSLKSSSPAGKVDNPQVEKRIREMERDVAESKEKYNALKEQYDFYTKEKHNNEKLMNEQFDSLRSEVRELTSSNCKLSASLDYSKEQIKLQQKNIATYKSQIVALEDRARSYESTIIKHEQSVQYLKEEIMRSQRSQAMSESEANHLRQENRVLKDAAARLQIEKDGLHQQSQNQNLLLNNLEMIKNNLERSETEGRQRLEQRLDEAMRELGAQRLRFQEEEQRFKELTQQLQQETDAAKRHSNDEQEQATKLRNELLAIREELAQKQQQCDNLSKKLQESLTPSNDDNPIMKMTKKVRELELKLNENQIEIDSLIKERDDARKHSEQYFKMAQNGETEIRNLYDAHKNEKSKLEAELKKLQQENLDFKSKISELEAEVQLINIPENSSVNDSSNIAAQLEKTQTELKQSLQKLADSERNLRNIRAENASLAESLSAVELKYANEMSLHSMDIQELTRIKADSTKLHDQLLNLQSERDAAKDAYQQLKQNEDENLSLIQNEKQALEERITDLNTLNANLHDQIEALSLKLSTITANSNHHQNSTMGSVNLSFVSANESAMETSTTMIESTEDNQNYQQLLQIIKFLRKEKDITNAKLDILSAEKSRLMSEQKILQKKVDELEGFLKAERTKTDAGSLSVLKHEEIIRKIETLDALTDSNRGLREERNRMQTTIKELNERIKSLEDELIPLNEQISELTAKLNEISSENLSLRTEAIKWRQRANVLVEKSNKNPEEFKRLQLERESLAKMLTNEKELSKQLNDEVNSLRTEKSRLEQEIHTLQRQLQLANEEKKKINDDFIMQKQNNNRIMAEVMDVKNKLLQKEEMCQKLTEELENKEAQLLDIKNKEMQIRKIAKRYKDSFMELKAQSSSTSTTGAELSGNGGANAASTSQDQMDISGNMDAPGAGAATAIAAVAAGANVAATESSKLRIEVDNLSKTISNLQEENERMRKTSDLYKASLKNVERSDSALRDAQARILTITDLKNAAEQELNDLKVKMQHAPSTESHEAIIRQYDETIERMQREFVEQCNAIKEERARITRENEQLHIRISQLNRQLGGLQQSSKPSTSSVTADKINISESSSPRTANVKPMSGSGTAQQSATVTPWRGGETPLASIRPISVQNSRTAAVMPTSQQTASTGSSTTSTSSTSTSSSSTSTSSSSGGPIGAATTSAGSSSSSSNTALVPPQQQVHTTGNSSSVIESMSSSPTSSHTDYMPSTSSSATVAVAAVPPMGSTIAAESSQEAESLPQQNETQQLIVSGGGGGQQQQVVALVSPRVEGSIQNAIAQPNLQLQQDAANAIQQPSTSGTTSSSTSHIAAVSSHSRHTPSSSNVTTTQAGHKRPRDHEGDSSTSAEEGGGGLEKSPSKLPKRLRTPMHSGVGGGGGGGSSGGGGSGDAVASIMIGITDADVEYQVPTSSQRDQEDEVHSIGDDDDDDEEDDNMAEADDGPAEGDNDAYDEYEQDQDMMDDGCAEVNESNIRCSVEDADEVDEDDDENDEDEDDDGNEVEIVEVQPTISGSNDNHQSDAAFGASTSQQAVNANTTTHSQEQDQQQSRAISSGSSDTTAAIPQTVGVAPWKQASSSSQDDSNVADNIPGSGNETEDYTQKKREDSAAATTEDDPKSPSESAALNVPIIEISDGDAESGFDEINNAAVEASENVDSESHQSTSATQSEIQDVQQSEENTDGVSSEGEKQAVEEIEEEGREAEASTSHSVNTRSRGTMGTNRGGNASRRPNRNYQRGGNRTPIVWGNDNSGGQQQQQQQQSVSPMRGAYPPQRPMRGRVRARGRGNLSATFNNRY